MSSQEHFNCIFCNESFDNKEDLQVHFRKHGDPKFDQNIKSKSKPQNESKPNNEDSKEDVEMVQCDVCSEVFPTISKAITHKHKLHPDHDAKYFCPWCGKLFTLKHLYNKHMSTSHNGERQPEEIPFHCEGCNVDFYVPSAMLYHNKFFHRQETDLPAIGQSKKLILFNQEVMQIYYCPFCGEEFNNKVNLHKHMTDDHSDENQRPDEVLRCPLCEAVFYHLDAYELHLTFHTPDDLYSETNELMEGLTEFSLETVAPIVESVENADKSTENEDGTVGIEQFLQLAMEDSADSELNKSKKKHKKHKKSKKSKQDAITLDEFLNMNKDVFGEGIDFQGIEEVPTRVVKKQLKVKKVPQQSQSNSSTEIQKLRKQGIVIKMKGKPLGPPLKSAKGTCVDKPLNVAGSMVTHSTSTNDVLSKLMTQTNNQLKIVKKGNNDTIGEAFTSDENIDNEMNSEHELLDINMLNKGEKSIGESDIKSSGKDKPKTLTMEEDTVPQPQSPSILHKKTSSGLEGNSKVDKQLTVNVAENKLQTMLQRDTSDSIHQHSPDTADYRKTQGDNKSSTSEKTLNEIRKQQKDDSSKNQLNALRQLNSGLVIKSVNRANVALTSSTEEVKGKEKINVPIVESSQRFFGTVKHLGSQITVKPSRPSNNGNDVKTLTEFDNFNEHFDEGDDYPEHFRDEDHTQNEISDAANVAKSQTTQNRNLNALQNLGKHISVKSQSQKRNTELTNFVDNENICNFKTSDDEKDSMSIAKRDHFIDEKTSKREAVINRLENISAKKISNTVIPLPPNTEVAKNKTVPKESPANILKHLTNITAKPLASKMHENPDTVKLGDCSIMKRPNNVKKEVRQDIEIYNIDDSDTDEDMTKIQNTNKCVKYTTPSTLNKIELNVDENKNTDLNLNEKLHDDELFDEEYQSDDDEVQTIGNVNIRRITKVNTESKNKLNMKQPVVPQQVQNTSAGLLKNIKIKPNSTHTHYPKVQNAVNYSPDYQTNDADSDNESLNGQVKIKEINDHELSDVDSDMETSNQQESNVTVEYPEDSNSEHEHDNLDDFDEDFSDIESALKVNKLKKPDKVLPSNYEFLKNNKNITIKSLKEPTLSPQTSNSDNVKTLQNKNIADNQHTVNKNIKKSVIGSTNQQMVAKQSMNTANKVNTVNKEVRVKTFQSQTVIEEITTTVTKTIRTVNQSHQEVRNSSETVSTPIRPQKMLQGIRPNMQIKNFPVTQLRHSAPPIGAKVRNCAPRMPTATSVKPGNYNQLVPVRPGVNLAGKGIRMATAKKEPQAMNSRSQVGTKLKMAPNVRSAPVKRPIVEDVSNQVKIKKPNEFSGSGAGDPSEAAAQVITSSHVNKSHFTSTSKVIRGNNVMTSTQVKAEASSQQHLTKLGNVAGLKIVKSSQVKQASLVEEKCEVSTPNRSTLEAIEKLQKHGLLVKKPCIDENEEADFSAEEFDYMEED